MNWNPPPALVPRPGRFTSVELVGPLHPARSTVEAFIAGVYLERYGARLQHFLPQLLVYRGVEGGVLAAVGVRLASEGPLFVEQYLDAPAEQLLASALGSDAVLRRHTAEVGNFAATSPGTARELIVQMTHALHAAQVHWVLFAATRGLRNAFARLHLAPLALAPARADRLQDPGTDWGSYYASNPMVMCGNVATGQAYLAASAGHAGALPGLMVDDALRLAEAL